MWRGAEDGSEGRRGRQGKGMWATARDEMETKVEKGRRAMGGGCQLKKTWSE